MAHAATPPPPRGFPSIHPSIHPSTSPSGDTPPPHTPERLCQKFRAFGQSKSFFGEMRLKPKAGLAGLLQCSTQ